MEVLERGAKGFEYTDDQKELRRTLRQFAEKEIVPYAAAWDEKEQFPAEVIRKLGELGFLGVIFPERYGGAGMSYSDYAIVIEELARAAGQTPAEVRQRMLDEIHERCYIEIGKPFPMNAQLIVRQGDVAEQVTRAAVELGAELIVVGMKGRSALAKLVLGDATGAILERAPCPVVVIPPAIAHPGG